LIAYKQAIQHAFGDVSDALIAYQKFHEVRIGQEQVVGDLEESVRLSNMMDANEKVQDRCSGRLPKCGA
jgi:outer membrane protein, multidrug efflux system